MMHAEVRLPNTWTHFSGPDLRWVSVSTNRSPTLSAHLSPAEESLLTARRRRLRLASRLIARRPGRLVGDVIVGARHRVLDPLAHRGVLAVDGRLGR